jgi:hypothetical protein
MRLVQAGVGDGNYLTGTCLRQTAPAIARRDTEQSAGDIVEQLGRHVLDHAENTGQRADLSLQLRVVR